MFQFDNTDIFEGVEILPEGDYEVVVASAEENETRGGTVHIELELVVRADIEQPYKNKHIWTQIWKTKATGQYNTKSINTIGKAFKIPSGMKVNSVEELCGLFIGKVANVKIKHEEYNGYTNAKVAFWNESRFPTYAGNAFKSVTITEENESDLPF